jgi:hypothetical protein
MKKCSDSDHEIMNLVEKNVGTPAILGRALMNAPISDFNAPIHDRSSKFRIYETAQGLIIPKRSGTQPGFIVQEPWCHGFVDTKCSVYTAFP